MNFFNSVYKGIPPWDIGRPQKEFVQLAKEGEIRARVLDVDCGTGENALYIASIGFEVWGIDAAPSAIKKAKEKAKKRGITVNFLVSDALELQSLQIKFDTVIDCGLFHVFSDEERPIFAASLSSALYLGGKYFMLCFSEHEPGSYGPRRVTQAEIRATFGKGWKIIVICTTSDKMEFHLGTVQSSVLHSSNSLKSFENSAVLYLSIHLPSSQIIRKVPFSSFSK